MQDIPYKIGRLLGKGGMADVYEAVALDKRKVAVKIFRDEKQSSFLRGRFMAEAKLLKTLYHPNIVRVHDCGIDGKRAVRGLRWIWCSARTENRERWKPSGKTAAQMTRC